MSRLGKLLLLLLAVLAVLLAVNTLSTDSETKSAQVTTENGRILQLPAGEVQVAEYGPPEGELPATAQPIVLLHCYTCSLHWFERLVPLLADKHRVIAIDLLGHGGSEKPESGYEIPNQAAIVAQALNELGVSGALVAGNSMGAMVTASLAEQASQLVDRAVVIDMAPNTTDFGDGLPFLAKLGYAPVIGEAMWRITPDFAIRDAFKEAFAPGYDLADGFDDPDQVIEDYRAMTYTAYDDSNAEADAFVEEAPLDQRFMRAAVPLLVIFGAEDQIFDADRAIEGFGDVPGARTRIIEGAGHAPQVEKPGAVAALIEGFSVELPPPPKPSVRRPSPKPRGDRPSRSRQRSDARRDGGRAAREPRRDRPRKKRN